MAKKERQFIVPIFIPNMGCPYRCIFCNQVKITSYRKSDIKDGFIIETIEKALRSKKFNSYPKREIAFFGGNFMGLKKNIIEHLLKLVFPYIKDHLFHSIRVSTRPDSMDQEKLNLMIQYGVQCVELGAQSMKEEALLLAKRGHGVSDTINAVYFLKENGLKVGLQLLPGLPGESRSEFLKNLEKVIELSPDMVRLYPLVVIRGTALERLYLERRYIPMTLHEAVELCAESCIRLENRGIPVIRMGLMNSTGLKDEIVAGPWHESFGFMVRSRIFHKLIRPKFKNITPDSEIKITVNPKDIPLLIGYKKEGIRGLERELNIKIKEIGIDLRLPPNSIKVRVESN